MNDDAYLGSRWTRALRVLETPPIPENAYARVPRAFHSGALFRDRPNRHDRANRFHVTDSPCPLTSVSFIGGRARAARAMKNG
jgi:hypothetical protein